MQLFRFDRDRALRSLEDPDGALWPVNAYSDADELNALLDDALTAGIIARRRPAAHIALHPLSLSQPDPVLALDPGQGPVLLGDPLALREREGENPLEFTLRLLERVTAAANALADARSRDPGLGRACRVPTRLRH